MALACAENAGLFLTGFWGCPCLRDAPTMAWLPAMQWGVMRPQGLGHVPAPSRCGWAQPRLCIGLPGEPPLRGAGVTDGRAGQALMSHLGTDAPVLWPLCGEGCPVLSMHSGFHRPWGRVVDSPALSGCPGLGPVGNRHLSLKSTSWALLPGGQQAGP